MVLLPTPSGHRLDAPPLRSPPITDYKRHPISSHSPPPRLLPQPDYERRLTAYARLTPELWSGLTQRQALPVMLACLHDLRNPDDLALR